MIKHILNLSASVAFVALAVVNVRAATITWTNTSGGNWSVAANWNPNQVPTNTDVIQITTPGTYTVTITGWVDSYGIHEAAVNSITLGAGGGAAGVQTFAMTNLNFGFTNLLVTNGGVLTIVDTDSDSPGTMTVENGGVFNLLGSHFYDTLIVTNGVFNSSSNSFGAVTVADGVFNSSYNIFGVLTVANCVFNSSFDGGALTVASGGVLNETHITSTSLTVASGGVMNALAPSSAYSYWGILTGSLINYGIINITNTGFLIGLWDVSNPAWRNYQPTGRQDQTKWNRILGIVGWIW